MSTKLRTSVQVQGRVLHLTEDAELLKQQLYEGKDLAYDPQRKLVDNISTDEFHKFKFDFGHFQSFVSQNVSNLLRLSKNKDQNAYLLAATLQKKI